MKGELEAIDEAYLAEIRPLFEVVLEKLTARRFAEMRRADGVMTLPEEEPESLAEIREEFLIGVKLLREARALAKEALEEGKR